MNNHSWKKSAQNIALAAAEVSIYALAIFSSSTVALIFAIAILCVYMLTALVFLVRPTKEMVELITSVLESPSRLLVYIVTDVVAVCILLYGAVQYNVDWIFGVFVFALFWSAIVGAYAKRGQYRISIEGTAIRFAGGNCAVSSDSPICTHAYISQNVEYPGEGVWGYITSDEDFVDEKEAARIAYEAKQISHVVDRLRPEHIWEDLLTLKDERDPKDM